MDPRPRIIETRLSEVGRIVAVSGGKGGIGKSSVASALALWLAAKGHQVGLLDLDFSGPSTHVILGIEGSRPVEDEGLIPPRVHGVSYMSIIHFAGNNPSPLRGADVSNAIIELLAITLWGELDFLVIDMPPGIGDATLDVIRLVKRMEFLAVTTASRLALEVTKKELRMLQEVSAPILGVVENMQRIDGSKVGEEVKSLGIPFLGAIPFDEGFEAAIGRTEGLLDTVFFQSAGKIAEGAITKSNLL
jgi:ATP-binding protein involved in chromosome partitioning